MLKSYLLAILVFGGIQFLHAQSVPTFTDMVVFGDSLSDVGNIASRAQDEYGVRYPAPGPNDEFNYTDGSFTDGVDTDPAAGAVIRVWHEQLASKFLNVKRLNDSLDGGQDYAFGGAKTIAGQSTRTIFSEAGFTVNFTIDNMGKQVNDYLSSHTPSATTLFIVWGGGNDLLDDPSDADVTQTANNIGGLVTQLATAGAKSFLVPNVPPLGMIPQYNTKKKAKTVRNQASASYRDTLNTVLDQTIASLGAQGINITVYRLDVYSLFMDFIANPLTYGYINSTDSSQGMPVNPDRYLFWDAIHPTTTGHYYLAAAAYAAITGQQVVSVTAPTSKTVAGESSVSFYVTRIGDNLTNKLLVDYTVTGTAAAGQDYAALSGVRKLKPGIRSAQVVLQSFQGAAASGKKTVTLTLSTGADYVLGGLTDATVTIKPAK
jgi:phospholipase/lecithinase/hemolysin